MKKQVITQISECWIARHEKVSGSIKKLSTIIVAFLVLTLWIWFSANAIINAILDVISTNKSKIEEMERELAQNYQVINSSNLHKDLSLLRVTDTIFSVLAQHIQLEWGNFTINVPASVNCVNWVNDCNTTSDVRAYVLTRSQEFQEKVLKAIELDTQRRDSVVDYLRPNESNYNYNNFDGFIRSKKPIQDWLIDVYWKNERDRYKVVIPVDRTWEGCKDCHNYPQVWHAKNTAYMQIDFDLNSENAYRKLKINIAVLIFFVISAWTLMYFWRKEINKILHWIEFDSKISNIWLNFTKIQWFEMPLEDKLRSALECILWVMSEKFKSEWKLFLVDDWSDDWRVVASIHSEWFACKCEIIKQSKCVCWTLIEIKEPVISSVPKSWNPTVHRLSEHPINQSNLAWPIFDKSDKMIWWLTTYLISGARISKEDEIFLAEVARWLANIIEAHQTKNKLSLLSWFPNANNNFLAEISVINWDDFDFWWMNPALSALNEAQREEFKNILLSEIWIEIIKKIFNSRGEKSQDYFFECCGKHLRVYLAGRETCSWIRVLTFDITEEIRQQEFYKEQARIMKRAQEIANFGSWTWDIKSWELIWTEQVYWIFGFDPKSTGMTYELFLNAVHPKDRSMVDKAVKDTLEQWTLYDIVHRIGLLNWTIKWVHERWEVMKNRYGQPFRMDWTILDITQRRMDEVMIRERNNIMDKSMPILNLEEEWNNGMLRLKIVWKNQIVCDKLCLWDGDCLYLDEIIEVRQTEVNRVTESPTTNFWAEYWANNRSDYSTWVVEFSQLPFKFRSKKWEVFYYKLYIKPISWSNPARFELYAHDISMEKRQAITDELTWIGNRQGMVEKLWDALMNANRFETSVVYFFMDLDRFKAVNDTYWHPAGDIILKAVAHRIKAKIRWTDYAARQWWDEFAVLLIWHELNEDKILKSAKVLIEEISKPLKCKWMKVYDVKSRRNIYKVLEVIPDDKDKKDFKLSFNPNCWYRYDELIEFELSVWCTIWIGIYAPQTCENPESLHERADNALIGLKNAKTKGIATIAASKQPPSDQDPPCGRKRAWIT